MLGNQGKVRQALPMPRPGVWMGGCEGWTGRPSWRNTKKNDDALLLGCVGSRPSSQELVLDLRRLDAEVDVTLKMSLFGGGIEMEHFVPHADTMYASPLSICMSPPCAWFCGGGGTGSGTPCVGSGGG